MTHKEMVTRPFNSGEEELDELPPEPGEEFLAWLGKSVGAVPDRDAARVLPSLPGGGRQLPKTGEAVTDLMDREQPALQTYTPRHESILALMERDLPPPPFGEDPDDQDLVEDIKHLKADARLRIMAVFQILRAAGEPGPMDSLQQTLQSHDAKFWNDRRIWQTVGDFYEARRAKPEFPEHAPLDLHMRFGRLGLWRVWSAWRNRRTVPAGALGITKKAIAIK